MENNQVRSNSLKHFSHLLQLSRHRDEFGWGSSNVAVQSLIVPLVLRVTARTYSCCNNRVVVPIPDNRLVVHIPKVPFGAAPYCSDNFSGLRLFFGGQRWRQNLSLRLCWVADNQQLLQRAPTAQGVILKAEAAGSWRGAPGFGDEFTGSSAVLLVVGPA